MAINGLTNKTSEKLYGLMADTPELKSPKEAEKPKKSEGKYTAAYDKLLSEYLEREPYDFNINTDKLYSQYAYQYKKQGEEAMRDTIAQAAEKTGGYGSSYGVTAGSQAYQSYLDKLNQIVPELEEKAYERYKDKDGDMREKLEILDDRDTKEYDRYRDDMEDYKDLREYYRKVYEYENDYDYDMYKALTDYILSVAGLENEDFHKELDYDAALARIYAGK